MMMLQNPYYRIRKSHLAYFAIACLVLVGVANIGPATPDFDPDTFKFESVEEQLDAALLTERTHFPDLNVAPTAVITRTEGDVKIVEGFVHNMHCAYPNVIEGALKDENRITLILHVSYNRLEPSFVKQVENWDGPVSVAVVFPKGFSAASSEVQCTAHFLNVLRNNHSESHQRLSAHIMIQDDAKACTRLDIPLTDETNLEEAVCVDRRNYTDRERTRQMGHYAVNDARNLARKLSHTTYILVADMDHFFSKDFEAKTLGLARTALTEDPYTALVYRIFEVAADVTKFPADKRELQALIKSNRAQEFHKFYGAHNIPKLQEWFRRPDHPTNSTSIQFYRPYTSYEWEPQFVSLTNIPFHDPTFFYSIRDNTVLRWEMCRAGFKFAIMDDVFMFHPGIKTKSENKRIDNVRNYVRRWANRSLRHFLRRLDKQYPETKDVCPRYTF